MTEVDRRIALIGLYAKYPPEGLSRYYFSLVAHLIRIAPERYTLLTTRQFASRLSLPQNANVIIVPEVGHRFFRVAMERTMVPFFVRSAQLIWQPDFSVMTSRIPTIPTIHDVAFLRHPETYRRSSRIWKKWTLREALRARSVPRVVLSSHFTARELRQLFSLDPARFLVVPPGVPSECPDVGGTPERPDQPLAFLMVGTVEPRKNHLNCLRALAGLLSRLPPFHLRIIGAFRESRYLRLVRREIQSLGLDNRVTLSGQVSEPDLRTAYRHSDILLMPSLYEGYGLPAVEALLHGSVAVVPDRSPLPDLGLQPYVLPTLPTVAAIQRAVLDATQMAATTPRKVIQKHTRDTIPTWEDVARQLHAELERIASLG